MNRFRTKKKALKDLKDDHISIGRPSIDEPPSSSHSGFFRRGKKAIEDEPKEEIDLSNALPPSDDFRTSLLMTGLSARFSMLREQDDPSTKIGKASDDSVLYPKRQSRTLAAALDDIAEVESIRAPPPFLRAGSFTSDTDSTHGSIMSRNRPGEGNVLFGGRQKIYRIPASGASKPGAGGGMGGRALYEDDVALSAFQKLKQREKDRLAMLDGDDVETSKVSKEEPKESEEPDTSLSLPSADTFDSSFLNRSDSPSPVGYNLRRETSSTTSSAARNSTAATSVVSQPTTSVKDGPQSAGQVANSATAERNTTTTRSRRLYEQGLNQDLHEHQSSAFSRIDTLTGKRLLGSRTPDFAQSPSPQTATFSASSLVNPARQVLTRGSAPNLRSVSPPATVSSPGLSINSANSGDAATFTSLAGAADAAGSVPVSPPLSPPMSESSEFSMFAIQPNDRGKATAMGVFQKPTLPYDESRFAQRQLQLQHGRETPTQRIRAESNASTGLSSRSSSAARQPQQSNEQKNTAAPANVPSVGPLGLSVRERLKTFLLDDDDEDDCAKPAIPSRQSSTVRPPARMQQPSEEVHPALRAAATPAFVPTSVSISAPTSATTTAPPKPFEPPMVSVEDAELVAPSPIIDTFADSPTLGPTSGLSGLVRQHLRSTSVASSVYSMMPAQTANDDGPGGETQGSNSWESPRPPVSAHSPQSDVPSTLRLSAQTDDNGEDDFASQLADAKRRVHERLTTYVESDSSRTTSPLLVPTEPPMPVSKSNPLGIGILKGKSSRGSLMERSRDVSQTRGMKKLGLGSTTTTSPGSTKQSFEDVHSAYVKERKSDSDTASRFEHESGHATQNLAAVMSWTSPDASDEADVSMDGDVESEAGGRPSLSKTDNSSIHPGLRAFRNARRQLQKQKEGDTFPRHGDGEAEEISPIEDRHGSRTSSDRKPPPVYYSQRDPSQDSWGNSGPHSRPESKASSRTDRDRSGSDTSNHGAGSMQPTRHVPAPLQNMAASGYGGRSAGSLRSPGLPAPVSAGLRMMRPGPAAPSSGSALGSTLSESMKKVVRKNEISEPTFLQSTSRVPTMSLPQSISAPEVGRGAPRPPSRTNGPAPPLPAMSPMRKQSAESRGPRNFGNFMRRRTDNEKMDGSGSGPGGLLGHAATTASRPTRQYGSSSDEAENMAGRRLRKQHTEGSGMPSRKMGAGLPPSHMDLPGGMI